MKKTPIQWLKRGIVKGDWGAVCKAYAMFTGKELVPPETSPRIEFPTDDVMSGIRALLEKAIGGEPTTYLTRVDTKCVAEDGSLHDDFDEAAKVATPELPATDPHEKFRIKHNQPAQQTNEKGQRACRVEPFVLGAKNTWKDDKTIAVKDIAIDKKLTKGLQPTPRRPATKKVSVTCCRCDKQEKVSPIFASYKDSEGAASYICNRCIGKGQS